MHRPTTEEELRARYGDEIVNNEKIVVHEAIKDEDTKEKGDLGYQKAEEAKANARKTYAEIRKEVIGV